MSNLTFDIEADGLLDDVSKIHCISVSEDGDNPKCFVGSEEIDKALMWMKYADKLIGHNIIGYDLPVLKKVLDWEPSEHTLIRDTLVLSHLVWPDIMKDDSETKRIPKKYWGRYSLRSFGYRLNTHKGEIEDFTSWSPELIEYCNQDVMLTEKLWNMIVRKEPTAISVDMEIRFAQLSQRMHEIGICFDIYEASLLDGKITIERDALLESISQLVPPKVTTLKTPQYWVCQETFTQYEKKSDASSSQRKHLVAGPLKTREEKFNPMSRQQVATYLEGRGWKPTENTPTGRPKVDESILLEIPDIPEAKEIARLYRLQKMLAMLSEGKESWLGLVRKSRIHPRLNTLGTVSGRTSCSKPNLQQVPSERLPFGKECRELFCAPEGKMLCGVDAKSLEVRCFAHYMAAYDSGEFADLVVSDDIHQANADLMNCDRQTAKNTFFALLYGASPRKISDMLSIEVAAASDLIDGLFRKRPAMKKLMDAVKNRAMKRGFLVGLDGRRLHPRSFHSSVNLLIQSAGAIVSKRAAVNTMMKIKEHGEDYRNVHIVGFIHDELILEAPEDKAIPVMNQAIVAFRETTGQYNLRCPMDGDGRVGNNWYEVH